MNPISENRLKHLEDGVIFEEMVQESALEEGNAIEELNREIRQSGENLEPCEYLHTCLESWDYRLADSRDKKKRREG